MVYEMIQGLCVSRCCLHKTKTSRARDEIAWAHFIIFMLQAYKSYSAHCTENRLAGLGLSYPELQTDWQQGQTLVLS